MKAIGYILIVLVLIAGGCFVYFATGVLVERQKWSTSVFRHELAIQGLPVEPPPQELVAKYQEDPERLPFPYRFEDGTNEIEFITQDLLKEVFQAVDDKDAKAPVDGGSVLKGEVGDGEAVLVTSQVEELERVQEIIQARIQGSAQKAQEVNNLLLALADTNPDRDYVLDLNKKLRDGTITPEEVAAAQRKLQGYFDYALANTAEEVKQAVRKIEGLGDQDKLNQVIWVQAAVETEQTKRQTDGGQPMTEDEVDAFVENLFPKPGEIDKRARIADVLFNVGRAVNLQPVDELSWQLRVITVVGLEQYVKTVTTKANTLSGIAARLRVEITQEEADFRGQFPRLVDTSRSLAGQLADLKRQVAKDQVEKQANQDLRTQRLNEVTALSQELTETTDRAEQSLVDQAASEKQLFDTQIQLGAALEAIIRLESDLRKLELDDGR